MVKRVIPALLCLIAFLFLWSLVASACLRVAKSRAVYSRACPSISFRQGLGHWSVGTDVPNGKPGLFVRFQRNHGFAVALILQNVTSSSVRVVGITSGISGRYLLSSFRARVVRTLPLTTEYEPIPPRFSLSTPPGRFHFVSIPPHKYFYVEEFFKLSQRAPVHPVVLNKTINVSYRVINRNGIEHACLSRVVISDHVTVHKG